MKLQNISVETSDEATIAIGIDWADRKHDFHGFDPQAGQFKGAFEQTPEDIDAFVAKLKQKFPDTIFEICVEQSKGALISGLLMHQGIRIYPINPAQLASYRKAMSHGGTKNDSFDAKLLAGFLQHYRDQLIPLSPDTPETRRLQVLTVDRRRIVDQRTALANEMQSILKQYFPLMLSLVRSRIHAEYICKMLLRWPTLDRLQRVKTTTLRKFFYACNLRGDHVQEKLESIKQAKPLTSDQVILETYSIRVEHLAKQLLAHAKTISKYDELIENILKSHADYAIVKSLPGTAVHMQSRMIAALGTDRSRFETAGSLQSFSGIAPVTSQSGNTNLVNSRWACPKFVRQTFQEYAGLSITKSTWAKAYYLLQLSKGKKPPAAKRALAFKWQRIIFRCWKDRKEYDESKYLARLKDENSPLLAFIEV
jgi:transposase